MIRRNISKKLILLVIVDLFIVIGSIFLSSIIVIGLHGGLNYIETNSFSFFITGVIYIFTFYMFGLYDFRKDFREPNHLLTIGCASIAAFIVVAFCFYVNWSLRLGRGVFLINGILITLFLVSWRYLYGYLTAKPQFQIKSLIIGAGWAGNTMLEAIKYTKGCDLNVIGFIDDDKSKIGSTVDGVPVIGNRDDLLKIVKR
ncbi:MAG: nucleoside-diphosphate sugar epimerase/dehydratase, partial [Candidatus Anammoxibacter sp.]